MNIYDIAAEAKVSTATVSKVINGREGVGEETRNRILKIMQDNNYEPRISNNQADSVALVYRVSGGTPLSSPYILKIVESTTNKLYEYGHFVVLIPFDKLPKSPADLRLFCQKRRIAGMVLMNLHDSNVEVERWSAIVPIVTVGSHFSGKQLVSITANNYQGAYDAVDYLCRLGHQRICALIPEPCIPDHRSRLEGYKAALRDRGLPLRQEWMVDYGPLSTTDIMMVLQRMFQNKEERPTAAFICDDMEVLRLSKIFQMLGISIPNDLSVVGFDDYETTVFFNPPLTTVRQPLTEFGEEAGNIIHRMIVGDEYPSQLQMETRLVIRQSAIKI